MERLTKFHTLEIEKQCILSLVMGILFGPIGYCLAYSFYFIIFFEIYVFSITYMYPPCVRMYDRILINIFYIFGWVVSRYVYYGKTGFENFCN